MDHLVPITRALKLLLGLQKSFLEELSEDVLLGILIKGVPRVLQLVGRGPGSTHQCFEVAFGPSEELFRWALRTSVLGCSNQGIFSCALVGRPSAWFHSPEL